MDILNYYVERGDQFPLILLHGNNEDCSIFCNQIDEFSKEFHVIAIDTRGHGNTDRGEKPFTIRQFADDLKDFMDYYNIEKAHILGFSDGGNIGLLFAMKYPERVEKLIVDGANLFPSGIKLSAQLPIEIGYRFARLMSKKNEEAKRNAEMLGLMVKDPNINPKDLKKIVAPTLVIAGTKDLIKASHTKLIADSIPNSVLRYVEGTHSVARDNPEAFNQEVLEFLC